MADDAAKEPTNPRDRDATGRPKNARPRDALGRPLPRGADNVLTEEELPDDPERLLDIGIEHFNARRFFQAHETWETAWHPSPEDERDFWQGLTQVAVGFTHYQRGNPKGSVTLLQRGARKIAGYGDVYKGVRVGALAAGARKAAAAIERAGTTTPIEYPTIDRTSVR
jgi:predicted metal-dependent hydrolase